MSKRRLLLSNLFFFFQAEDGIRDRNVTGVQTCALPIFNSLTSAKVSADVSELTLADIQAVNSKTVSPPGVADALIRLEVKVYQYIPIRDRSEERRVGKECRSRWGR